MTGIIIGPISANFSIGVAPLPIAPGAAWGLPGMIGSPAE